MIRGLGHQTDCSIWTIRGPGHLADLNTNAVSVFIIYKQIIGKSNPVQAFVIWQESSVNVRYTSNHAVQVWIIELAIPEELSVFLDLCTC